MAEKCTYPQAGLQTETCPECGRRHEPVAEVEARPVHFVAAAVILVLTLFWLAASFGDPLGVASWVCFALPFGLAAIVCLSLLMMKPGWGVPITRLTVIVTLTCAVSIALFFITGLWIW